jgi:ATP-dependent DNA helicase RecG
LFDDKLEITSPGGLPNGLSPEEFGTKSILRNPNLANLMQRIHYIEKMGTGIARIRYQLNEAGLPPAEYHFSNFVKIIFYRLSQGRKKSSEKSSEKNSSSYQGTS